MAIEAAYFTSPPHPIRPLYHPPYKIWFMLKYDLFILKFLNLLIYNYYLSILILIITTYFVHSSGYLK